MVGLGPSESGLSHGPVDVVRGGERGRQNSQTDKDNTDAQIVDGLASGLLGCLESGFISPVHSPFLFARHLMGKYSEHGSVCAGLETQSPCFLAGIFPHLSTMWRLLIRCLYILSYHPPIQPILRTPSKRVHSKFVFGWFRLIPFLQRVLEKYQPV